MKVLIVDDEENIRSLLRQYLAIDGIDADQAENGLSAQRILQTTTYDAVLVDLRMPGMDGIALIKWIRSRGLRMPIVMMSAHGEITDAVTALKEGAQDYVVKPFEPEDLVVKLKKLVEAENSRALVEEKSGGNTSGLLGESPEIRRIRALIVRVGTSNSTVLITGESGTGKEVVAREIHAHSNVSAGPFVPVNIGGVPENLLESELFGYEKGAFTGAVSRKEGLFEKAKGGTLFLDEIGDMPLALQVKILRVLQERKVTHLGGTEPIPIDARIVAATNKDLEAMVREGKFREDLFYRLNVVRVRIPPLRERREDIPLLASVFLRRLNEQEGRHIKGFTPEALARLKACPFYGNVRELQNVLERAVLFCDGDVIEADGLELRSSALTKDQMEAAPSGRQGPAQDAEGRSLREMERDAIVRSLRRWEGNRTRAAKELGISRRTLQNKIQEFDLEDV